MQALQFASDAEISIASTKGQAVTCLQETLTTLYINNQTVPFESCDHQ